MSETQFAIPFALALFSLCVCERIMNAVLSLFVPGASPVKRVAARQLVGQLVQSFVSVGSSLARLAANTGVGLLKWWALFIALFVVFSALYVTFEEYPDVWIGVVHWYNLEIGPWLSEVVVIPLQILEIFARAILPIWDGWVWFWMQLWRQGLFPILLQEINTVLQIARMSAQLAIDLAEATSGFVLSFVCTGRTCLQPDLRVFNAMAVMGDVREVAALSAVLLKNVCGILAAPVDLVTFPLLDLNLAQSVHYLWNALLQLTLVLPHSTYVRCTDFGSGSSFNLMLCTPDFGPFFDYLVAGLSSLGLAVDNWANVALVIVQQALTGSAPTCDTANSAYIPDLVAGQFVKATTVVGLTEWLYAVTDGTRAVYQGSSGAATANLWPYPVDISLGVAAVTYQDVNDLDASAISGSGSTTGSLQTTAMLGCTCSDTGAGVNIQCVVLPMSGASSANQADYLLQVLFPDTSTAGMLACAGIDVYVRSVRWPFTHYSQGYSTFGSSGGTTQIPTTDCISRGNCRDVDATIWVVPRCSSPLNGPLACVASACFPFCMAARPAGSGNDNVILASAARWRTGVTVLEQDCVGVSSTVPAGVGNNMGSTGSTATVTGVSGLGNTGTSGVFVSGTGAPQCQPVQRVTSVINKPLGNTDVIAAAGQPFVITGDTIMTMQDLGGGSYSVLVERLSGDQANSFSLTAINQALPALPPPNTPAGGVQDPNAIQIAYDGYYSTMPHPIVSTTSQNYVFYAANPTLEVYSAYLDFCSASPNSTELPKFGFIFAESYAGIWIYRVRAYTRCTSQACAPDLVDSVEIPGLYTNFSRACNQEFTVGVAALEYLNPDNIAVRLLISRVNQWNPDTMGFEGDYTAYTTVWLHPDTMQIASSVWQDSVPSSNLGALCPAMQRLPRVGTFAAEAVNIVVHLTKATLYGILYTPAMVAIWRAGGVCPGITASGGILVSQNYYHSVLANCGNDIYSLDDAFDSMDDAAAVFWQSLLFLAEFIQGSGGGGDVGVVTDILDGEFIILVCLLTWC